MNKHAYNLNTTLTVALVSAWFCRSGNAELVPLTKDNNGAFNMAANPRVVMLNPFDGTVNNNVAGPAQAVNTWFLQDTSPTPNNIGGFQGIPVPVLRLNAGDMVTVNFQNNLPQNGQPNTMNNNKEGASIHWHGIELDNDSDGTSVTQDSVLGPANAGAGGAQSYTYRFIAPRPGLFWFHSHMVPGNTLFSGMYGIMIIPNPCEAQLIANNVLPLNDPAHPNDPTQNATFPLALTDIAWDSTVGDPQFGKVGSFADGVSTAPFQDVNKWIHDCGQFGTANQGLAGGQAVCNPASYPGNTVLVNGCNPDTTPGLVTMNVLSGQTIRLQLFNEALSRSFNLQLQDPAANPVNLYRIGGQGGLLNNARLEGGNNLDGQGYDTKYPAGTIMLSSGVRADVVATIPAGLSNGQKLTLYGLKTAGATWNLTTQPGFIPAKYPIAYFNVTGPIGGMPNPVITNGTPILSNNCPSGVVMSLTNGVANVRTNFYPPPNNIGTMNGTIMLTKTVNNANGGAGGKGGSFPSVDGYDLSAPGTFPNGNPLDGNMGNGDFKNTTLKTFLMTDRYVKVGETYVLSVKNVDGTAHPFHLHGFSMQPLAIFVNGNANPAYTFPYNEFLDTLDVYNGQTLVFAVRFDDRQKICDAAAGGPQLVPCVDCQPPPPGGNCPGGALGRWLYHCHIANHGVLGMMGEIIVLGNANPVMAQQPPDTSNTGVDVLATFNTPSQTVADDFQWWQNPVGPVSQVTIWGSWLNDNMDPNTTFELKFWTDVPAINGPPSRPGWQAWEMMFPPGTYTNYGYTYVPGGEWFVVPGITNIAAGDTQVYQYGFPIPAGSSFYPQTNGATNWLSVTAYPVNPNSFFGWKTCVLGTGWNDDSTWSSTLWGPPWTELLYLPPHPYSGNLYPANSMNQAFAIYTVGVDPSTSTLKSSIVPVQGSVVLSASLSGGQVRISWVGDGILQSADDLAGPWTDISDAKNPYVTTADGPRQFYRVRIPQ